VSFHYEDAHQDAPPVEHTHSETLHQQHHPEPSYHNIHHHPAPMPILSMVPQYVRGEEHVSTFVPPMPNSAPIAFAPPLSHKIYETSQTHHQPPGEDSHIHQPLCQQPSDGGRIYQPQPVTPLPAIESYQPPRSPTPEAPIFEAPKSEWDPAR
jgi:glycogenin glucosyltransferase